MASNTLIAMSIIISVGMATAMNIKELRGCFYGINIPLEGLRPYRVSEQQVAGVCGTEFCHPPHYDVPLHSHDSASFCVVLQGSLTEVSQRKRRTLAKGSIVFTPPGEIHRDHFHDDGGRCFLVEFLPGWNDRLAVSGMKLEESVEKNSSELAYLAFKLYKEFRDVDNLSALLIEGLSLELLAEFCRHSDDKSHGHSPGWLRQAQSILHDSFAEPMTLADIAAQVGVHPVHLARAFRKCHRCSLGEYQRKLRIEYASRQLLVTKLPIAAIALSAGFSDQAHLSRVFKNQTGMTPSRYRNSARVSERVSDTKTDSLLTSVGRGLHDLDS